MRKMFWEFLVSVWKPNKRLDFLQPPLDQSDKWRSRSDSSPKGQKQQQQNKTTAGWTDSVWKGRSTLMSCNVRLPSGNMRNALSPLVQLELPQPGGGHKRPPNPPTAIFQSSYAFNLFRQTVPEKKKLPGPVTGRGPIPRAP